ncbi:MAG: efflux RND transporter periplasmic adaptor subunit, partial [Ignavibacteria bacterium]
MTLFQKYLKIAGLLSLLVLYSCGNKSETEQSKEETKKEELHSEDERGSEVVLTDEQIKVMGIELAKVDLQNISGYIRVNGEVMVNPDQESKVGSIISGRVKKIYVKEGSFVRAGQTLAVIENPELINIQVDYINARNEYEFVKREYERQLKLSEDNIGSKKTLAELENNYRKSLANFKTLEEKLATYGIPKDRFENIYKDTVANLQRYYTISAPISGNIVKRNLTVGQYVEPSIDLF